MKRLIRSEKKPRGTTPTILVVLSLFLWNCNNITSSSLLLFLILFSPFSQDSRIPSFSLYVFAFNLIFVFCDFANKIPFWVSLF
ncbi:hypothetical protein L2E82_40004 [Cichorium intybus]|uniref:Uncharacterized protein n=1 Tax=Cichorium intybus TaxID=13427 RepID=A0ACB9AKJ7_CICIN|nr:hypothetical protein L1887_37619 [Cichorium endivia]KAI3710228.1 hypothetical protein L2E82_40004 [Cichorium intybus]